MKAVVLHPLYFGPIDYFKILLEADQIIWEVQDHYQKQTYRTRQYIYGANGILLLNTPISHRFTEDRKRVYKSVVIENSEAWQRVHWRSLQSAYQSSPFFAYYEPEIKPLFQHPQKFLLDFNLQCIHRILECLEIQKEEKKTQEYKKKYSPADGIEDYRYLSQAKRESTIKTPPYFQVFDEKHGFLPNLSILDLLFNLGPETTSYLV